MKRILATAVATCVFAGCATAHFDKTSQAARADRHPDAASRLDEINMDAKEIERFLIEEELKAVDVEQTVVYVDRPVYSPEEPRAAQPAGADAVVASTGAALRVPQRFVNGVMLYDYDETFVYEIHCQPYRVTDVMLEPGEEALEMPFLSEDKVWEIGAGVSRKNNLDMQHFFLKPSVSGLTTSMIIITNRRVYHFLLKSYKDRYMTMVRWEYPRTMPYHVKTTATESPNRLEAQTTLVDPTFLSFDYKMTYSAFKKPIWLPKRVYDDGRKTYIELDEQMLNMASPVLFNKRNERINYRVQKNLIVIDELIEQATLRRGKEKVVVVKKRYRGEEVEE
jgi:type IV secretion system protein VirB9